MSSTSECPAPGQGGSARDEVTRRVLAAVEAAGPGGTGIWDLMQATGLSLGDVVGALDELGGPREPRGPGSEGACLYGGIPGQGKSGAVNVIAAELAAREGAPRGRD